MRHVRAGIVGALLLVGCAGPPREPCAEGTPLGTVCGFAHPEDVEWIPAAGVVLVSNMRDFRNPSEAGGFLAALVPGTATPRRVWPSGAGDVVRDPGVGDPRCPGPPGPTTFSPHGITARDGRAYVIAHSNAGGREAVEIFTLHGTGADVALSWAGCVPQEPNVIANDVAVAPDGEVIESNYVPAMSLWTTIRAGAFGSKTGDVMAWRRESGWRHVAQTAASMPNGVAVSPDGRQLFYAETGTGKVYRLPRDGDGPPVSIDVGGNPDNLSWTARGTLLVATHTGGLFFVTCAFGRLPCRSPWALFEIVPQTMTATRRFAYDGDLLGAVSSGAEVGPRVYLGSVFDDRIGVLTLATATSENGER